MKFKQIPLFTERTIKRFWETVELSSGDSCWSWRGRKNPRNYGVFCAWDKNLKKPNTFAAHRVAYHLTFGSIPIGLMICHKCDNPSCCNPHHLFPGTAKENTADMFKKNRDVRCAGEKSHYSKLTASQVSEIRQRYFSEDVSQHTLAEKFGVTQSAISHIIANQNWANKRDNSGRRVRDVIEASEVTDEIVLRKRRANCHRGSQASWAKLTEANVLEICRLYDAKEASQSTLAKQFNVSRSHIGLITQGRLWRHIPRPPIDGSGRKGKLQPLQVSEILSRLRTGNESQARIAADYGVTQGAISFIFKGQKSLQVN